MLYCRSMATAVRSERHRAIARPPLGLRALQVAILAMVGVYTVSTLLPDVPREPVLDPWLYSIALVSAAVLCIARPVLVERDRAAWTWLAVGVSLWTAGDLYFTAVLANLEEPPYPSFADAGYVLFYPCAYIGVVLLVRSRIRGVPAGSWLDGAVAGLAAAAVSAALAFDTIVESTGGPLATVATNLAYPVGDLLLLALVIGALALLRGGTDPTWWLLGAGFVAFSLADTAFLFQAARGTYVEGSLVDAGWLVAVAAVAFAGWQAERPGRIRPQGLAGATIPTLLAACALAIVLYGNWRPVGTVAVVLAGLCLLVAGIRTVLTYRESVGTSRREALTDHLTGLPNRRRLETRLGELLEERPDASTALLLVGLDRFKQVNDSLGHGVGDELLRQVGSRLAAAAGPEALVARVEGDEFAVVSRTTAAGAEALARRLLDAVDREHVVDGAGLRVDASIGIALAPEHAADVRGLLLGADTALAEAKAAHTTVETVSAESSAERREALALAEHVAGALDRDDFVLAYQPVVELSSGATRAVEVVVQWRHPQRGLLPAAQFLPFVEQAGLARRLTARVLAVALDERRRWLARGVEVPFAVNLGVPDLLDIRLPYDVARALADNHASAGALAFEVAEDVLATDEARALRSLERLRRLGAPVAVDGYGGGRSSLAYLRRLPVDELKLDASLVARAADSDRDAAVLGSAVQLGRSLGLCVTALGVDSPQLARVAARAGCERAQGALFAAVDPAEDRLPARL